MRSPKGLGDISRLSEKKNLKLPKLIYIGKVEILVNNSNQN